MREDDELARAAGHEGSPAAVRTCLARGSDPNLAPRGTDSPLCLAAMFGHTESVALLVAAGADPNHVGAYGRTPLHYVRSPEVVHCLLDHGARFEAWHDGDEDALHDLITRGDDVATARALLGRGFPVIRYHTHPLARRARRSHLGWAAFCLRIGVVQELLAHGGNPDELDESGEPVVFRSISRDPPGGNDVVRALIEAGARVEVTNRFGQPLLERLSRRRDPTLLALALARSGPGAVAAIGPATLLCGAASAGNAEVVMLLLEHAAMDVDAPERDGATALMAAAGQGAHEIVQLLLRCGADPRRRDAKGNTALHRAAYAGNVALFETLLAAGCVLDDEDALGYTPFARACEHNRLHLVRALLDRGVAVDRRVREKAATPLMLARSRGAEQVAKLLLERGADPALIDEDGRTAEDHARALAERREREDAERRW